MWAILDSSAVLDLVERDDMQRRQLVTHLREIAGTTGFAYPEEQPITLWVPPIALGELALLTFPAYRVSRAYRPLNNIELNRQVNVAWEAIGLLDPNRISNLRQRLPSLNFTVNTCPPSDAVASVAWETFTSHRKNQRYLHCEEGRIKSIGDTADQLVFELAYALGLAVKTGAVLVSSDRGLLTSVQRMNTYASSVRLALIDSKNPTRRLQGEDAYTYGSMCPGKTDRCQSQRTDSRTDCKFWPHQSQIT